MAENNKLLTLDDFRTDKYSELILLDYIVFTLSFVSTETERPELKDLCKYVLPVYAAHWQKIGIFLNIQPGQLNVIKLLHAHGCCVDLFIKWLEGKDNVTWEKIFEAIDLFTVLFSTGSVATTTDMPAITGKSHVLYPLSALVLDSGYLFEISAWNALVLPQLAKIRQKSSDFDVQ